MTDQENEAAERWRKGYPVTLLGDEYLADCPTDSVDGRRDARILADAAIRLAAELEEADRTILKLSEVMASRDSERVAIAAELAALRAAAEPFIRFLEGPPGLLALREEDYLRLARAAKGVK